MTALESNSGEKRLRVDIGEDADSYVFSISNNGPEIRRILGKIIEGQEDFTAVAQCGSFSEALTDFTRYKPDVAFVDIDLGGESGLECAKILAELNPKVKIVFATAHSEYMTNAFAIYAYDYLVKPFKMERVIRTLKRIRDTMYRRRGMVFKSLRKQGRRQIRLRTNC